MRHAPKHAHKTPVLIPEEEPVCSLNITRALLRLERTMNLLKGGEGRVGERGWGREGGEGTEGGWGERVGGDVGERGRVWESGREGG